MQDKQDKHFYSGFAAIIGRPNVGKSTLMNALVGEKVAIVSPRSQTTRNRIMGILSGEDYQAVFLDTPGLHTPRNKLGESMVKAAQQALDGADILLVLLDASDVRDADRKIIEQYAKAPVRKALVVNKLDTVSREELMRLMHSLNEAGYDAILPISALKKKNLDELMKIIREWLPEGPQYFPKDMITDQPERFLIAEMIREKALRNLREEIPHGIGVDVREVSGQGSGMVTIHADIYCEKASHKGVLIGKQGSMLRTIGERARADIEKLLGERVNLQLWIKVRDVTIRPVRAGDAADLSQLNKEFGNDGSICEDAISGALERGDSEIVLVAIVDGVIVGFADALIVQSLCYAHPRADIEALYVRRAFRRQGVGSALLLAMERALAEKGISHFHINVHGRNEAALSLYRGAGYAAEGEWLIEKTLDDEEGE